MSQVQWVSRLSLPRSPTHASTAVLSIFGGMVVGLMLGRWLRIKGGGDHVGRSRDDLDAGDRSANEFSLKEGWEGSADVDDWEPLRLLGRSMVDFTLRYYKEVHTRPVRALVKPGYLKERLTQGELPLKGERWSSIMSDVESHIMPGLTHWQHPRFFAWFPANSSAPSVLGDMLGSVFNIIGFSWESSPAATELETIVMELLRRAVGLPDVFSSDGEGGGVIQGSASEGTLVAVLAARKRAFRYLRECNPAMSDHEIQSKMTLYCSDQSHSSVKKAAIIAGMGSNLRNVPTRSHTEGVEEPYAMDPRDLAAAMRADRELGMTPIFVNANVGTTNTCAIDPIRAIGDVCRGEDFGAAADAGDDSSRSLMPWLHVDAAYAGGATVCPENRWIMDGVEGAESVLFNPHKWLLTNFDCTAMWVKCSERLVDALSVTPEYLKSKEYGCRQVSDFRDWQVPLGRKFRSLKLWFVLRAFGLEKIRDFQRRHCRLAQYFENLVLKDDRFELTRPARFGLVVLRFKGTDAANEELRSKVISSGKAFFSCTTLGGRVYLRVAIGTPSTKAEHVDELWAALQEAARDLSDESSTAKENA